MSGNFLKLYVTKSVPQEVFYLEEGKVFFYSSNSDKYSVGGKNLIVGVTEILVNSIYNENFLRVETAVTDSNSKIKKISKEKFLEGMNNFSFQLNVAMVLAKQVLYTNRIIHDNMSQLAGDEAEIKNITMEFYSIITRLASEYEKRKLPWLKELYSKHNDTLTFKKGEAYLKASEPTKISDTHHISDRMVEYQRGTIICEENQVGNEMYILESGTIEVSVKGRKVAMIDQQGTAFGEMALLLSEKRTATLTAKNNVTLTKITRDKLKEISLIEVNLLKDIAASLARKHYYNVIKIENTNEQIFDKMLKDEESNGNNDKKMKILPSIKLKKELSALKNALEDIVDKKSVDFLDDIVDNF